jgi:hypothetical protein
MFSEYHEGARICRHRVIVEEASDYLLQPTSLVRDWMVSSPSQFFLDLPELGLFAVSPSFPREQKGSSAQLGTNEGKAQEIEGLRLSETPSPAFFYCKATELDQPGFLGMKRQRELLEPLSHQGLKPDGVCPALESDHLVIRIARYDHGADSLAPSPAVTSVKRV